MFPDLDLNRACSRSSRSFSWSF